MNEKNIDVATLKLNQNKIPFLWLAQQQRRSHQRAKC